MRDARIVAELIAEEGPAADFRPYRGERLERMRRLRLVADIIAVAQSEDAPNRDARRAYLGGLIANMDPEVFPLLLGSFAGPEHIPAELVHEDIVDRVTAAGGA